MSEIHQTSDGDVLPKVDGRTRKARKYRDLVKAYANELGADLASLPTSAQQVIRSLAQVSILLDTLRAQDAAGQAIDGVAYCSSVNVQRRLLRDLEALKTRLKPKPPSLQEHLARNYRAPLDAA